MRVEKKCEKGRSASREGVREEKRYKWRIESIEGVRVEKECE